MEEVKEIKYDKVPLTDLDILSEARESIYELIQKAKAEAIRHGIQANSIMINKNMVHIPVSFIGDGVGGMIKLNRMVCGLNAYFTNDELPENYSFAIFEGPPSRLEQFESIGMEPDELRKAAELYRRVKEVME
jgi:hypothetical protein